MSISGDRWGEKSSPQSLSPALLFSSIAIKIEKEEKNLSLALKLFRAACLLFHLAPTRPMDRGRLNALVPGTSARALRSAESISPFFSRCFSHSIDACKKKTQPQQQRQPLLLSAADVAEAPVAALASAPPRSVVQLYRSATPTAANAAKAEALAERARREVSPSVLAVETETCFNVGLGEAAPLGRERAATLAWLLAETFEPEALSPKSSFGTSGR